MTGIWGLALVCACGVLMDSGFGAGDLWFEAPPAGAIPWLGWTLVVAYVFVPAAAWFGLAAAITSALIVVTTVAARMLAMRRTTA